MRLHEQALLCEAINPFNPSHRCTLGLGHSAELAHTDGDATWLPDPISLPPPHDHHVLTPDGRLLASGLDCRCDDPDELLKREDTICAYCGKPDCTDRWNHDRWNEANEDQIRRRAEAPALTWWKWGKR